MQLNPEGRVSNKLTCFTSSLPCQFVLPEARACIHSIDGQQGRPVDYCSYGFEPDVTVTHSQIAERPDLWKSIHK